ncbi:magnesium transporter NIPA-domain-containing protein [Macrophomina phaseolina]|uniref:Magnesium transporter NIPA-domain-containing protein n=1 Tax=Macrophomina phaseolina TaxID=35725 RepID=A0ABQ8GK70_9PEZI|nr:magnesium transporter NIPA-domain-containing protein [Macrophomina phaseolina]
MDLAGDALVAGHQLYARSGVSTGDASEKPAIYKVIGIILALSSGLFIGVSFVVKKKGLLAANEKYSEEAGEGYGYLKNWMWWTGMTLMIIGEVCNFVAYAFVDAILVTPMGALAVVVTAILSAIFLKERLSFVGKVGCFNCIVGSVVIVINAPEQSSVSTIQDLQKLAITPGFLSYTGVIILIALFLAVWAAPRYGKKTMMVDISICSLIGGLSVVATQGLGSAILAQIRGVAQFNQWFLYVVLVFVIATLLTEIIYLNKALNVFNAALVTPTYYVFFTSATIVTSAILFQGFKGTGTTISTVVMGFLQICSGVVLLQLSKSAKDVPDAAVFQGDLDQVRTVAEQEEPEYEPRADTLRGGAAILRTFSVARKRREAEEAKTLASVSMEPIGENESIEWDGLRRRKTVLGQGQSSLRRQKTVHPPLGMSHFPDSDSEHGHNSDDDVHPGFFSRLSSRGRAKRRSSHAPSHSSTHPVPLESIEVPTKTASVSSSHSRGPPPPPSSIIAQDFAADDAGQPHVYGLPPGLRVDGHEDTSYHAPPGSSPASTLSPPPPPPHASGTAGSDAKRQFSFTNVFHPFSRPDSAGSDLRPMSARSGLSFANRGHAKRKSGGVGASETEEERLGLVKGDSRFDNDNEQSSSPHHLPRISDSDDDNAFYGRYGSPPTYSDLKDDIEDPELGVLSDEERWTVPMPQAGVPTPTSAPGHSRNLTGGGLASAPLDVRVPVPGVPAGAASPRGGSAGVGSSRGEYAHARSRSDSSDDFEEAIRKL